MNEMTLVGYGYGLMAIENSTGTWVTGIIWISSSQIGRASCVCHREKEKHNWWWLRSVSLEKFPKDMEEQKCINFAVKEAWLGLCYDKVDCRDRDRKRDDR